MDWRVLRELKAAEEAEKIANSFGGGPSSLEKDVFGSTPAPITPINDPRHIADRNYEALAPQFDVSDKSIDAYTNSAFTRPKSTIQKLGEQPLQFGGNMLSSSGFVPPPLTGEKAIHKLEPYLRTAGAPLLTAGALGAHAAGYGPDQSALSTLGGGFKDLAAGPAAAFGIKPPEGLASHLRGLAGEAAKGLRSEGMSPSERKTMLAGVVAEPLAEMVSLPGDLLPGLQNPAFMAAKGVARGAERLGIPNPTLQQAVADFLSYSAKPLQEFMAPSGMNARGMHNYLERRGAINMPGKPRLTAEQSERITKLATEEAGANPEKLSDYWTAGALRSRELDTMSDDALRFAMRDFSMKEARSNRPGISLKAEQVAAKPPTEAVDPMETLGLSDEASREILGVPEDVETAKAITYAPRMEGSEAVAARLSRVEKAIETGGDVEQVMEDAALLPREDVWDLALQLGGNAERNKSKGLKIIREALEKKAKEPKQSPTTVAGRQEAKELEMAAEAEKIASSTSSTPLRSPPSASQKALLENTPQRTASEAGQPPGSAPPPPRSPEGTIPGSEPPISETPSSATPPERNARWYAGNHIDSLEKAARKTNSVEGRVLAEKLRENIVYGESNAAKPMKRINDSGEKVLRSPAAREEVADVFAPSGWQAAGAPDLRAGRFQVAVDDASELMGVRPEERMLHSPESQQYANDYVGVISDLGHEAERLGVKTANGNPFVAKEKRFIQQIDPSATRWMVDKDPLFEKLKTQLSAVYPDADVTAIGDALKSMANVPLDRPAAFEFERLIPMMPAAIVDDAGQLQPILRYVPLPTAVNPSNPAARIVESQWMRLGGIKSLGQDLANAMANTDESALAGSSLGQALQAEGGAELTGAARGAIGAIYRRPEAGWVGANPATWDINKSNSRFAQGFRSVFGRITPALNLMLQGVKSIPQTLGEVPAMTSAFDYARAVGKTVAKYGKASEEAEMAGAVQRKFLEAGSAVYDRHRPIESAIGKAVNKWGVTERFNDFVKDFNDTIAYTAGTYKAERMLANGAKQSDFFLMDEMNLPQSVQDVFRNPSAFDDAAKAAARQTFGRLVAKETQFHSKNPALKGRFENDAALRWVMPYMSYSINTGKNTIKDIERVLRAAATGVDPGANFVTRTIQKFSPFGTEKEPVRNALTKLVGRFVGMEMAGEVVADISSTMQGKDPFRRDRSALARVLENLSYVGFLGPAHFAFDMAASNLLEGAEKKKFAQARAGSRAPTLGNPTVEAVLKAGKHLATGDVGEAAWDVTGGQSPLVSGVGRATGLIDPAGSRPSAIGPASSNRTKDMLDPSSGRRRKDMLDGGLRSRQKDMLDGGTRKRKRMLD